MKHPFQSAVILAFLVATTTASKADVFGDYVSIDKKGKAFHKLLCSKAQTERLVADGRSLGISDPEDLVASMRILWCSVSKDSEARMKSIKDRIYIPFKHVAAGHDHLVKNLSELEGTAGSLNFGELPAELDVEVQDAGTTIRFGSESNMDSWVMKLIAGKWKLQYVSFCDCDG